MLFVFEKFESAVRYSTEKTLGFPRLTVIFDAAVMRDSLMRGGCGEPWGHDPRIRVELAKC